MKKLMTVTILLLSVALPVKSHEIFNLAQIGTVFLTTTDKIYVRECCYFLRFHATQIDSILEYEMTKLFHKFQTQAINEGYSQEESEKIGRLKTRLAYKEIERVSILNCDQI